MSRHPAAAIALLWALLPGCPPAPSDALPGPSRSAPAWFAPGAYSFHADGRLVGLVLSRREGGAARETWVLLDPDLHAGLRDDEDTRWSWPLLDMPAASLVLRREGPAESDAAAFCVAGRAVLDALLARPGRSVSRCWDLAGPPAADPSAICDVHGGASFRPLSPELAVLVQSTDPRPETLAVLLPQGAEAESPQAGFWLGQDAMLPPLWEEGRWPADLREVRLIATLQALVPLRCILGVPRGEVAENAARLRLSGPGLASVLTVGRLLEPGPVVSPSPPTSPRGSPEPAGR